MQLIETFKITDKNTRTTQSGKKVASFKAYPFDFYIGGVWLPDFVNEGDVVTAYVDQIEVGEYNGKPQYNAKFPKVTVHKLLSDNSQQAAPADFGRTTELEVDDEDLPF